MLNIKTFFYENISFHLFTKNVFKETKNSIFLPKHTKYGNNVQKQNRYL